MSLAFLYLEDPQAADHRENKLSFDLLLLLLFDHFH